MPGVTEKISISRRGFTLIELLAVIAIIGVFVGAIGLAFRGGGQSTVGMQSAQSTLVGYLTLARSEAAVSGHNAAVLINTTKSNPDRYYRYAVVVVRSADDSEWIPLNEGVYLPAGCYFLPNGGPGSAIEPGATWVAALSSTALSTPALQAINESNVESWRGVSFSRTGSTSAGSIVLANGRVQPSGATDPVIWIHPDNVRGVAVTIYGQTRLVNEKAGF